MGMGKPGILHAQGEWVKVISQQSIFRGALKKA